MQRLNSSVSAAAALLNKGEELAGSAAAAANAVEGQVASLLTAAAGVEARVMGLERTFTAISQVNAWPMYTLIVCVGSIVSDMTKEC